MPLSLACLAAKRKKPFGLAAGAVAQERWLTSREMTKYRLHNRLGSGGVAVQAALTLAGIGFDYEPIASLPNDAVANKIGRLNPWGQVPVL